MNCTVFSSGWELLLFEYTGAIDKGIPAKSF
jgi:hypothetical protein